VAAFKAVFEPGWAQDTKQRRRSRRWAWFDRESNLFPAKAIKLIKSLALRIKTPPCGGAMRLSVLGEPINF